MDFRDPGLQQIYFPQHLPHHPPFQHLTSLLYVLNINKRRLNHSFKQVPMKNSCLPFYLVNFLPEKENLDLKFSTKRKKVHFSYLYAFFPVVLYTHIYGLKFLVTCMHMYFVLFFQLFVLEQINRNREWFPFIFNTDDKYLVSKPHDKYLVSIMFRFMFFLDLKAIKICNSTKSCKMIKVIWFYKKYAFAITIF